MQDYEEGPCRRVSRSHGRKPASNNTNQNIQHKKSTKGRENSNERASVSAAAQQDWFDNSFTGTNNSGRYQLRASTPKSHGKGRRKSSTSSLNNSDAMFAELDLDQIVSQTQKQSQIKSPSECSTTVQQTGGTTEKQADTTLDSTLSDTSHSLNGKFANYKSTQSKKHHGRKEVIIQNTITKSKDGNDTSFSFSFVENGASNDTLSVIRDHYNGCDKSAYTYKDNVKKDDILNNDTSPPSVRRWVAVDSQILATGQWNTRDIVASTQLKDTQDKQPLHYRCTPYKTASSSSDETQTSFDITCLKDDEGVKFHCTPFTRSSGTQQCNPADSQIADTGRSMLKCTPCIKDLTTSTQSMCDSQGKPVYNCDSQNVKSDWALDQSQWLSTAHCQRDETTDPDTDRPTQLPATGLCNMTGLIVDTQKAALQEEENLSGEEDLFSDSIHVQAPVLDSQVKESDRNKNDNYSSTNAKCNTMSSMNYKGTSQSQCIDMKVNSKGKSENRKRSFEDDIESIFQDSQKRSVTKRAKNDSFHSATEEQTNKSHGGEQIVQTGEVTTPAVTGATVNKTERVTDPSSSHVHMGAMSYGARNKSHSTLQPKTPEPTSLQQRIKSKLKENVGRVTPPAPGSLVEQLRAEVLERVQLEAQQAKDSPLHDIGPFYGLPSKVKHLFENYRGIKTLYSWQEECLNLPAIQARKNLIYSLPTSGGKTLVAEVLILQELLCQKRDALLILPFVSIVQEKVKNMAQFAVDLGFHVEEYAGSKGRFPPVSRRKNNTLYIATIEKAHSIVNSLIELDRMDKLGIVVVDELHMIGEGGSRGATLESTLMKIVYAAGPAQIIGMSATLSNIQDLCRFLKAETYTNDFRPVELTEFMKLSENVYKIVPTAKCPEDQIVHDRITCFQYPPEMEKTDPDHLLGLALEIIPDKSCLVFCPTKKNCENVALMLCKLMSKYRRELSKVRKDERKALLKELYSDAEGKICPVLQYTVQFGVAYHHSGLTVDERKLVEEAYSAGVLCMLTCTSTLAAGVNLPAKRVILRSPYVGRSFISRSQYKQMVGRAGRAGIDSSGESITICKTGDREKVLSLLQAPLERCHSSLVYDGGRGMRNLVLSTIGLKITTSTESVFEFLSHSLSMIQEKSLDINIQELCRESLQRLVDLGLVLQTKTQSEDPGQSVCHSLEVTELGRATVKGPIDPDYSNRLYADLQKGKESLVVASHLHLLYLVTPYDAVTDISPSWFTYFNQMSSLTANDLKVASLIGVPEVYIAKQASQQRCRQKVDEFVVKRFYLTLMLYELWNQRTVWEVAERFDQPRGFIQTLLSSAASFASCVLHFCQMLEEFWAYQDLMGNFVKRLSYCVTAELIPLVEIPGVKMGRAKLMYNAGFRTLSSVANTDVETLVKSVQFMPRKVAKQIIASAKLLLTEKAEAMMEEVEHLVSIPDGNKTPVTIETMKTPATVNMQLDSQMSETSEDGK